jgi:hypothetical protein
METLKVFRFSKTNLTVSAALLTALSQPGRVYFNTNASYYVKLFSNLKWNASFYGNWDNRPPAGFSGSDYRSTSGISWTYGLKYRGSAELLSGNAHGFGIVLKNPTDPYTRRVTGANPRGEKQKPSYLVSAYSTGTNDSCPQCWIATQLDGTSLLFRS